MPTQTATLEPALFAFSDLEIRHKQSPRERANALALSGRKELLTEKAMRQHAKALRVALRYDTNGPAISSPEQLQRFSCAGLSAAPKLLVYDAASRSRAR